MVNITATEARNNIGKLWSTARKEPVTVESAGKRIAVVVSPEEYDKLTSPAPRQRQFDTMKHIFEGVDVDELLAVPIDDMFAEYMP